MQQRYVDPESYTMADYEAAVDAFIESVSRHPAVHAIYQMGTVSAPGISDIDMIVVMEDDFQRQSGHALSRLVSAVAHPYLFWHPPMYLTVSLMQEARGFCNIGDSQLRWGTSVQIRALGVEESWRTNVLVAAETLPWSWSCIISLTHIQASVRRSVRTTLAFAKIVEHTIGTCSRLFTELPDGCEHFVKEAEHLRREWAHLSEQKYERLNALVLEARGIVESLLCRFVEFLTHQRMLWEVDGSYGAYLGHPYDLFFLQEWQERQERFEGVPLSGLGSDRTVCFLPIEFLAVHQQYGNGSGTIHRYIRRNLVGTCSYHISDPLRCEIARRLSLTHCHLEFVKKMGTIEMLYPPAYFGFRPPSDVRSRLRSWLKPWANRARGLRSLHRLKWTWEKWGTS